MGKLIDDLLAFSRLGRQAVRPRYISSVELSRMVADIVADMNAAWPGRSIQVMQAELPGCEADPALLRHVWFNLISNAYKYTQTRTAANIEIGYQIERSEVSYYVKDNGVGFNMSTSFLAFSSACILMSNSTAPGSAWPSSSALSSGMAGAFGRKPAWVREPPFGFTSNRLWPSDVLQKIYSGMNSA
jgi:light-regulated signal transduction histidine kinase (bacteriophytochrome)